MATGRTISANHLTELDKNVLELCKSISVIVKNYINDEGLKKDFWNNFGKISMTRDAGAGRGGGKLQRDALCVRGRQGKAPYSNRNLRWHPLVVAAQNIDFAKPIERIEIDGEDDAQTLIFVVKINGEEISYPSDKVYELSERFVVLPEHWIPHIDKLKHWNDTLWTQNSCIIPAMEACEWQDAVEVYAFLAITVAIEYYNIDFNKIYNEILKLLKNQKIENFPSNNFPINEIDFKSCPVCKKSLSDTLSEFRSNKRVETWQPAWSSSKRSEGEDGSNQILHIEPLIETQIRHKVGKVKFGHRWCNVAMTDHSLDETLDFFEYIIRAHNRI
jgi:hypothetical protein